MSRFQICYAFTFAWNLKHVELWIPVQYSIYSILHYLSQYHCQLIEIKSNAVPFHIFATHTLATDISSWNQFPQRQHSPLASGTGLFPRRHPLCLLSQKAERSADPATLSTSSELSKNPHRSPQASSATLLLNSTPDKFPAHFTSCAHKNDGLLCWCDSPD